MPAETTPPPVHVTRPIPGAGVARFLKEHRLELVAALRGMCAFPMRPVGRSDATTRRHEESVRRRFDSRESNLFGLSLDPRAYRGLPSRQDDELLYDLFILGKAVSQTRLARILGSDLVAGAIACGLLTGTDDTQVISRFRLVPHGRQLFLAEHYSQETDMVYLSNDSLFMASYVTGSGLAWQTPGQVVDLGTGTGLLGCSLASEWAVPCTGIDINSRAVAFARVNGEINDIVGSFAVHSYDEAEIPLGSLVVANPPFVFMPAGDAGQIHSDGGSMGLGLTLEVLSVLSRKLPDDGQFAVMTQSVRLEGESEPFLLQAIRELDTRLDMEVENVGSMPVLAKFEEFYRDQGVAGLNQLIIRGTRGGGCVSYQARNRFESEFCFG